jgi:hypothetical protein
MRATEIRSTSSIEPEGGDLVRGVSEATRESPIAPTIEAFDHRELAVKLACLMSLFPESLPNSVPYTVFQYRQVGVPDSRVIAINTRRPLLRVR